MSSEKLISIVITVYNEEGNIIPLVDQVEKALEGHRYEIVYVDDGSTDNSVAEIKSCKNENIRLVLLSRNFGQCAALKAGIDSAQGDYVVTMDGDLQNDPSDILHMIKTLEEGEFDLVTGIRHQRKDGFFLRLLPSKLANLLIRKVTGVQITDNGCALKVFRSEVVKDIPLYGDMHRFISILAAFQGARLTEVDVKHHARVHGESKYGLSRTFKVISDLMMLSFFRKYMQKPMHFFGTVGVLSSIAGGIIMLYLLALKILGNEIWGRPLLLLGILLVIVGFQTISIGFTFEYQKRIYFEQDDRKPYNIRNILDFSKK